MTNKPRFKSLQQAVKSNLMSWNPERMLLKTRLPIPARTNASIPPAGVGDTHAGGTKASPPFPQEASVHAEVSSVEEHSGSFGHIKLASTTSWLRAVPEALMPSDALQYSPLLSLTEARAKSGFGLFLCWLCTGVQHHPCTLLPLRSNPLTTSQAACLGCRPLLLLKAEPGVSGVCMTAARLKKKFREEFYLKVLKYVWLILLPLLP